MNLSHSFLYIIATVSILGLVGCSAPEPTPAGPLSVSDLAALDPEDLAAALSDYLDELGALYTEEVSLLDTLWQFETDHGQVDTIQTAAGPTYSFRFYPRWRPNYIGPGFGADYDSVEEISEFRDGLVSQYRTLLTRFDLSAARVNIPRALRGAQARVDQLRTLIDQTEAEIESERAGQRPPQ